MQALIGNSTIKVLKPQDKPYEVRDTRLKGFLVRVQPSGSMSYIVEYGRGKRITLSRVGVLTSAQARDRATEILADVVRNIDPMAVKKKKKVGTFKAFLDHEYGPWVIAHRKDGKATLARLRACFAEFNKRKLIDISAWIVEKWRVKRLKDGINPTTINRDISALKAALSRAMEWGLLETHPLSKVKPSKTDTSARVRYLDGNEERRLRKALRDDYLGVMVLVSINTGLRRGELFSLTWNDIDLTQAMLTISGEQSKNNKTRHIPLNREALDALKQWKPKQAEGLVFPNPQGKRLNNVKRSWASLLKRAKITGFRWHDMRHHFASKLVMASVDLNTVRELLGHGDIKMTLRYSHLAPEHKAEAVSRLVTG